MASPPIIGNSVGRNPVSAKSTPTSTYSGASWLGKPPVSTVAYPIVPGLMWQAAGQGVFPLIERVPPKDVRFSRGPRLVPQRGTFDCWVVAPAAGSARHFLLVGDDATTFVGVDLGYVRIGVDDSNNIEGLVQDADGTNVAVFTDSTAGALVEGQPYNVKLSWDATAGTVSVKVGGVALAGGDFSTAPSAAWSPVVPTQVNLFKGPTAPQWDATINLLQVSSQVL